MGPSSTWNTGGNSSLSNSYWLGTWDNVPLIIKTNNIERLRIKPNGNIGVGTSNPVFRFSVAGTLGAANVVIGGVQFAGSSFSVTGHTMFVGDVSISGGSFLMNTSNAYGYDMAINGDAIFERVVVKAYSDWPDYVFAPSYKLMTLEDLKRFILVNSHLPNVPDQSSVEGDGVDVYQMNKLLLLKIEELTLYILQLEERLKKLEGK